VRSIQSYVIVPAKLCEPITREPELLGEVCDWGCPDPLVELAAREGEVLVHGSHLTLRGGLVTNLTGGRVR
jgi:hypothetical protein